MIDLSLHPFGSLQVITNTTGSGLDPDGYALHVGEPLDDAVIGDNPRTVTVAARDMTVSTFQVTCAPSPSGRSASAQR